MPLVIRGEHPVRNALENDLCNMDKILVMDTDEAIRSLYGEAFMEEGYDVVICGDGSRLMALIEQKKPDVIVMEI